MTRATLWPDLRAASADDAAWERLCARRDAIERDQRQQIRAAGVDPDSERGQRLLRKMERNDLGLCLARNRQGGLCLCLGDGRAGRCKFHGGLSTGAKTPEGKARAMANLRRGR